MSKEKKGDTFNFLKLLINLEFKTEEGRINYRWGILVVGLALLLTATDWILKVISYIVEIVKTAVLQQDITVSFETTNPIIIIVLMLIFFVLCLGFLLILHFNKKKLS